MGPLLGTSIKISTPNLEIRCLEWTTGKKCPERSPKTTFEWTKDPSSWQWETFCVFSCSCLCVFVVFASPWGPVAALGNWLVLLWSFCICLQKVCVSFDFTLLSAVIWLHYMENKPLLSDSSEAGRNTGGQWNCASPRFFISNYFITPVFTKYWYFLPICNHSKMMHCSMMLILGESNLKRDDFLCIAHWCLAEWRDWLKRLCRKSKSGESAVLKDSGGKDCLQTLLVSNS